MDGREGAILGVARLSSFNGITWWAKDDADVAVSMAAVEAGLAKETRFGAPPYRRFRFHRRALAAMSKGQAL